MVVVARSVVPRPLRLPIVVSILGIGELASLFSPKHLSIIYFAVLLFMSYLDTKTLPTA